MMKSTWPASNAGWSCRPSEYDVSTFTLSAMNGVRLSAFYCISEWRVDLAEVKATLTVKEGRTSKRGSYDEVQHLGTQEPQTDLKTSASPSISSNLTRKLQHLLCSLQASLSHLLDSNYTLV